MKLFQTLVFAAGLCLLGGCDGYGHRYAQSGPGTDLASADYAARSDEESKYLGKMCDAAGFGDCGEVKPIDRDWALVAQAGLNDIDARCDSYLAWLNDQKRSQKPILKQLGTLSAATGTIMHTAGAGGNAVTIVAQAFNIVTDSYTNYASRLILEVDHNTVTSLVRDKQLKYREMIARASIRSRPDAVNVIRSYLRICLPDSIEANINANVVLATAGGAAVDAAREKSTRLALSTGVIGGPKQTLDPTPPVAPFEDGVSPRTIAAIQKTFCLPPDGRLGGADSATRKAFVAYLVAQGARTTADAGKPITRGDWGLLRSADKTC